MLRIVLIIVVVLGLIIVGVLAAAAFRPRECHTQRSTTTSASAADVYDVMSDLHRWPEWSPYQKRDPAMKMEFSGPARQPGSKLSWDGNADVGAGQLEITEVKPNQLVALDLEFFRPWAGQCKVQWRIDEQEGKRRVTWVMDGNHEALMPRIVGLFLDMDKMIGGDFEAGLESLKQIVEMPATVKNP